MSNDNPFALMLIGVALSLAMALMLFGVLVND